MIVRYKMHAGLILSVFITACGAYTDKPRRPPIETVAELRMLGITFSATGSLPSPSSQPASCSEDETYIGIGDLKGFNFYFSPDPDNAIREIIGELIVSENNRVGNESYSWEPYTRIFSTYDGAQYAQIPPDNNEPTFPTPPPIPAKYFSKTYREDLLPDFILFGDFYLADLSPSYPVAATHIELWFSGTIGAEPKLVNRVALEDLIAWRNYALPNIDGSGETARCVADRE